MAELLVRIAHDPSWNAETAPQTGDVVGIKEDGAPWGRMERKSIFLARGGVEADWHGQTILVLVPGVSASALKEALLTPEEEIIDDPDFPGEKKRVMRKRRINMLDYAGFKGNLPPPLRNQIETDGEITVTADQLRLFLKTKLGVVLDLGV